MTDLTNLLDRASELDETPMPISDDLKRARSALRRQRRTRGVVGVGSVAAIAVIAAGVVGTSVLDRDREDPVVIEDGRDDGSQLFAAGADAGPYTFGKLPVGWEVQGISPFAVTIAPVGFADQNKDSFVGKLVIVYDQNPPSGDLVSVDGRDFFTLDGGNDHSRVSVRTRAGEPEGVVSVQYPISAGWDEATMIEFLDAVQVNESAQPSLG